MAYGPNFSAMFARAATYVDKILKGTRPSDLSVEQPTTFDFVINLKTAHALGLTIPSRCSSRQLRSSVAATIRPEQLTSGLSHSSIQP